MVLQMKMFKSRKKPFIAIVNEYLDNTTIHGFKYIVNNKVNFLEKIIWTLVIIAMCVTGIHLVINAFNDWDEKPVLTKIDSITYPLVNERFPSVTVCTNQIKRNINEWKYVEVALQMIDDECFDECFREKGQ